MAMEDIRRSQELDRFQHGAAKQGVALGIVMVVAKRGAVELIAIEERRVVDEIELHSGRGGRRRAPSRNDNGHQTAR